MGSGIPQQQDEARPVSGKPKEEQDLVPQGPPALTLTGRQAKCHSAL